MPNKNAEISVKGKAVTVPILSIDEREVVITGKGLRIARLRDEDWTDYPAFKDPSSFLMKLRSQPQRMDIFTFCGSLDETGLKHPLHIDWEDVAAVPLTNYSDWWENLPQESRKNVRRAEKRGVVVRIANFDDAFVRGIKDIYDESPIRQGRKFWHFGKDIEAVKRENATFLDRSEFVAAYSGDELIGFIKIVYVGKVGRIMQIISKNAHSDKRPPNALLAKAVEACCQRGMSYFVYGQYFYGTKGHTPITEFKHRNGFKRIMVPRYFAPLTLRGKLAMALKLHQGFKRLVPARLMNFLLDARTRLNRRRTFRLAASAESLPTSLPRADPSAKNQD